ncbi:hypothetical protein L7F22_040312 [Adiantum nelumboides]|nr:hypothetical protein [Adiantum nelumboides]
MKNSIFPHKVQLSLAILMLSFGCTLYAHPIPPPNLHECRLTDSGCCIPLPKKRTINFTFHMYPPIQRLRRPAHHVDDKYIQKYKKAYELMRSLPSDDPRSLLHQANAHCSMCTGGYFQPGIVALMQVHFSWLFFPWHRWFIYFHERILAKLLGDPNFSLPFWNWDNQIYGNSMPTIFNDNNSALYDLYRDATHTPETLIRLDGDNGTRKDSEIVSRNLFQMYRDVVVPSKAHDFMGGEFR